MTPFYSVDTGVQGAVSSHKGAMSTIQSLVPNTGFCILVCLHGPARPDGFCSPSVPHLCCPFPSGHLPPGPAASEHTPKCSAEIISDLY